MIHRLRFGFIGLYCRLGDLVKVSNLEFLLFMIRRIVCLMLVPALLANQAVLCCAHTHSGSEPSGHSTTRSHVHQSGHWHDSHQHQHQHGDSGGHQHDDSDHSENSNPIVGLASGDPVGHDHDAIYIGKQVDLHLPINRISIEGSTVATSWLVIENPSVIQPRHRCQVTRAGPLGLYSAHRCAIFMQTGRLLI